MWPTTSHEFEEHLSHLKFSWTYCDIMINANMVWEIKGLALGLVQSTC